MLGRPVVQLIECIFITATQFDFGEENSVVQRVKEPCLIPEEECTGKGTRSDREMFTSEIQHCRWAKSDVGIQEGLMKDQCLKKKNRTVRRAGTGLLCWAGLERCTSVWERNARVQGRGSCMHCLDTANNVWEAKERWVFIEHSQLGIGKPDRNRKQWLMIPKKREWHVHRGPLEERLRWIGDWSIDQCELRCRRSKDS